MIFQAVGLLDPPFSSTTCTKLPLSQLWQGEASQPCFMLPVIQEPGCVCICCFPTQGPSPRAFLLAFLFCPCPFSPSSNRNTHGGRTRPAVSEQRQKPHVVDDDPVPLSLPSDHALLTFPIGSSLSLFPSLSLSLSPHPFLPNTYESICELSALPDTMPLLCHHGL
jgi:hypothetical protein